MDEANVIPVTEEIAQEIIQRYSIKEESGDLGRLIARLSKKQKHALTVNGPHPHLNS
jgi:hypothetical protein